MKKTLLWALPALMLCACSGNNQNTSASGNEAEPVAEEQAPSAEDVTANISERVSTIYAEALANDDESVALNKYGSANFVDTYAKYSKAIEGMMGSIECNIWSQAQDVSEPKVEVDEVNIESDNKATVTLSLTNFGEKKAINLPVVLEEGEWKIDDIVAMGQSMKSVMLNDIKAFAE